MRFHALGSFAFIEQAERRLPPLRSVLSFGRNSSQQSMTNRCLIFSLALCSGLFLPLALVAQEEQVRQRSSAIDLAYAFLPLIIIGAILWWSLRKSQRTPFMRRSMEHYERSEQHMQRMEQIGERIAAALEKQEDARSKASLKPRGE